MPWRGRAIVQRSVGSVLVRRASTRRTDRVDAETGTRRREPATSLETSATGARYRSAAARSSFPGKRTAAGAQCLGDPPCRHLRMLRIPDVERATGALWPSYVACVGRTLLCTMLKVAL